jgi:four helix bundle protein
MSPAELRDRTGTFARLVFRVCAPLLHRVELKDAARQFIRSSASVATNYRSACLARSRAEFIARLCLVLEEADESLAWAEYLRDSGRAPPAVAELVSEALELTKIFAASRRTSVARHRQRLESAQRRPGKGRRPDLQPSKSPNDK